MMNHRRIEALENRVRAPGACPECGRRTGEQRITEVHYVLVDPPPGFEAVLPEDNRPICGTCDERIGVLFSESVERRGE